MTPVDSRTLSLNTFLQVARNSPPNAVLSVEGNQLTVLGEGSLGRRDVTWVDGPARAIRSFTDAVSREVSPFASQTIASRHGLNDESSKLLRGAAVEELVAEARTVQQHRDIELVMQGVADADRFRALGRRASE